MVRTDGLSGGRCTVTWLPNFLGWVDYFIFLPMVLRWRACENQEKKIDRQLVMSRNSSRIKAIEKHKEGFCLATKILISFRDFQSFTGFFQNSGVYGGWRFFFSQFYLFICCTEDHPCTVVNNDTCAVRDHTVNWRQRSFIRVFFVWASVLSMDRCYKLFLPKDAS